MGIILERTEDRHEIMAEWPEVTIRCHDINKCLDEINEWAPSAGVSGQLAMMRFERKSNHWNLTVSLSCPELAFAVKMRWG